MINDILKSDLKGKGKVIALAQAILDAKITVSEILEYLKIAKKGEKGHLIESCEIISTENPALLLPHLVTIIALIYDQDPRVKLESAKIVGNLAPTYADLLLTAIKPLKHNALDDGTVVRWSAAFAICSLVLHNQDAFLELQDFIEKIIETEMNNGVKNQYIKALKKIK